jgi:predicted peptidase
MPQDAAMKVAGVLFLGLAVVGCSAGAQSPHIDTGFLDRTVEVAGVTYRYQVYVPNDYSADKQWPLLVDLHGNGAQGNDGIRQTAHFLGEEIRLKRTRFPMLIVFPQAAPETTWSTAAMQDMVNAEMDSALREFRGDPGRVYLSGFSMGGAGVYDIAARWPERFAALVAISGFVPQDDNALVQRLRLIPLRIVHGANDERVPVDGARRFAADLKNAGASVQYSEYPDTRHGPTAEKAYADHMVIDWLLSQRRTAAGKR